jgi:hypothetical protein
LTSFFHPTVHPSNYRDISVSFALLFASFILSTIATTALEGGFRWIDVLNVLDLFFTSTHFLFHIFSAYTGSIETLSPSL